MKKICSSCDGTGAGLMLECSKCDGIGSVDDDRAISDLEIVHKALGRNKYLELWDEGWRVAIKEPDETVYCGKTQSELIAWAKNTMEQSS